MLLLLYATSLFAQAPKAGSGNRLAYLDELDPYYPHAKFPKLTTPQWVGEDGVEAVVILAIDDMRDTKKYETYLRPILRRLQKIDGRAPVSIMTCSVDPKDPQLQTWLKEGLSIECHTIDHPCPFFKIGFEKAKSTYDRCIDLMNEIPGNKPVAFRMPCCDSLNTPSPRFYAEIFNKQTPLSPLGRGAGGEGRPHAETRRSVPDKKRSRAVGQPSPVADSKQSPAVGQPLTPGPSPQGGEGGRMRGGNFLSIDSSVFVYYTSDDPELPKNLTLDAEGNERFKRYLPMDRSFVNTIENYPYPYVIGNLCWQLPCMTPSDWQAQHLQKPNNPKTVEDWKAALDCTVIKQGVMTMVFHPHGWIRNDQMVELIDYAVAKHGKKVKFLTFKEALERLNKELLNNQPIRHPKTGEDNGMRLFGANADSFIDGLAGNERIRQFWLYARHPNGWNTATTYFRFGAGYARPVFGVLPGIVFISQSPRNGSKEGLKSSQPPQWWYENPWFRTETTGRILPQFDPNFAFFKSLPDKGELRFRDIDGDATCEVVHEYAGGIEVHVWIGESRSLKRRFSIKGPRFVDTLFRDLNADGKLDIIFSNEKEYGVHLFTDMEKGWSKKVLAGKRGGEPAALAAGSELPMISRHGQNNGFWVHSGYLWWSNEDTALLKDHVDRRKIADLLK